MLNKDEAIIVAELAIAKLLGKEYFVNSIEKACQAYTELEADDETFEYFLGFDGDLKNNTWIVYARVLVNLITQEVTFLDYKKPDGVQMEKPIKPVN